MKIDQYNSPHQQTKSRNKRKSQQTQDKLFTKSTSIQHNSRRAARAENGLRLPWTTARSRGAERRGRCLLAPLLSAALRVLSSAQQSRTGKASSNHKETHLLKRVKRKRPTAAAQAGTGCECQRLPRASDGAAAAENGSQPPIELHVRTP